MTGKKLSAGKGIGVKGRLTVARIDTLQNFYGLAIQNNKGNSEAISKATMAIFDHYKKIYCMNIVHLAKEVGVFFKGMKNPLPNAVVKVIKLLFDRLF